MEKIQAAIDKARAERARSTTAAPGAPAAEAQPPAPSPAPSPGSDVAAAWAAMPALSLKAERMEQSRIVAFRGGHDATGFDMMRTRVMQQMRANNWRRLAITSPTAACGKSTIALNLAFSLARQPDLRTLLLEMDMRRPSLAGMLGIRQDVSLADVLAGTRDFESNVLRHGANLGISTTPGRQNSPAELLNGSGVAGVLADIEARYDPTLTIFDMPPMLVSDDMMAFAGHVDCVLLVAGAEATTVKEIDLCERELASQTNVMGVILNKCRYMGPEYGYGYYG